MTMTKSKSMTKYKSISVTASQMTMTEYKRSKIF